MVYLRPMLALLFGFCFLVPRAQEDTAALEEDCWVLFFKTAEHVKDPARTQLTFKDGKVRSLASFLRQNPYGPGAQAGRFDFDGDGIKELVTWSFTGGAHCCDEVYLFRPVNGGKYQQVGFFSGGNTCMGAEGFTFSFYEWLGYFFTCYACSYATEDTVSGIRPLRSIGLQYRGGKLTVDRGDAQLLSTIRHNLSLLGRLKWDGGIREPGDMDDGRRKEVAMNLAVHYYSFGRDLAATRKLFTTHYRFPDAAKVWASFAETLAALRKKNDF